MIWFACKQCGKKHSRPDTQAGTMVFCNCGRGIQIPWSSTTAPDVIMDAEPVGMPAARAAPVPQPRAVPVPVPAERDGAPRPRRPEPVPVRAPVSDLPLPSRRADRLPRRVRAHLCFNHDEDASKDTCAACKLPFCGNCLVSIQDQLLCGPCKNFRIGGMGRTTRVLPLSILALVVSLVSGPVMLILSLLAVGLYLSEGSEGLGVSIALCVLSLLLPLGGLVLALTALRRLETKPQYGGRGLAAGAACAAAIGVLWSVAVAAVVISRSMQG
jgi:hypothetical protein